MASAPYIDAVAEAVERLASNTGKAFGALKSYSVALLGLAGIASNLGHKEEVLYDRLITAQGELARLAATPGISDLQVRLQQHAVDQLTKQLKVQHEIGIIGNKRLGILSATNIALHQAFNSYTEIQRTLISASVSDGRRLELAKGIRQAVLETGIASTEATKAAAALVNYGYDNKANWIDSVKLVARLHETIGLSVDESARLASIYETSLNVSARRLADTLTTIVERTALSASEAAKMAETLGLAAVQLRDNLGSNLDEVGVIVGEYESAFKRLGGQTGSISSLIEKLTQIQGLPAAGLLGIRNPEFLASASETERTLRTISETVNYYRRSAGGSWGALAAQMEAMSAATGISLRDLALLAKVEDTVAERRAHVMTLEERFSAQMAETGQGWSRLKNQLASLLQIGLYPVISVLNRVVNSVADALAAITEFRTAMDKVAWSVGIAVTALGTATAITVIPSLVRLTSTLYTFAAASAVSSIKLGSVTHWMAQISNLGFRAGTAAWGAHAGFAGLGATSITVALLSNILLALIPLAAIAYSITKLNESVRQANNAEEAARHLDMQARSAIASDLQLALLSQNAEEVERAAKGLAKTMHTFDGISVEAALYRIQQEQVQPTAEAMRATEATKVLSTQQGGTQLSVRLEAFLDRVNRTFEEDIRTQSKLSDDERADRAKQEQQAQVQKQAVEAAVAKKKSNATWIRGGIPIYH